MRNAFALAAALALTGAALPTAAAFAEDPIYTGRFNNTAVGGYDAVAYHTEGAAIRGEREFSTEWRGAEFRFASQANLDLFLADPEAYAPAYGGYCAWAISEGYTAKGDPNVWNIVDGVLYLNYNTQVQERWSVDIPGHIERANANYPDLVNQ
ncbi:YHS domain-containing (seleno)protein [Oceanicaulis sp. LC35]|uniref:YHS domain-containing (seleno)protein n=1 Tax=Oceanicaulis sp. LC35 TaxID=3349635 RepID=UPI003F8326D9